MAPKIDWESQIGRRLRLRDLHVLHAVVQHGSMAKAAVQLGVSQPAVSEVIADLEHALGVRLLDRSSRGIEPTMYGNALLKRSMTVFDELKQSIRDIEFLADPTTGEVKRIPWNVQETLNSPAVGNVAFDPDGFLWRTRDGAVSKVGSLTGEQVETFKTKKFASTYGSAMSDDGRYFGGGAWPKDGLVIVDRKTGEVLEPETSINSGPARGEFDRSNNYWAAGRGGQLIKYDTTERRVHEYPIPTPFVSLYTTMADKNGEVWAGEVQGGRYLRFDPKTEHFTEYVLPEPYSMDRESWIDNSTSPVSVWYVEHEGYLVHIQPMD